MATNVRRCPRLTPLAPAVADHRCWGASRGCAAAPQASHSASLSAPLVSPQGLLPAIARRLVGHRWRHARGGGGGRWAALLGRMGTPRDSASVPTEDGGSVAKPPVNRDTYHCGEPPPSKGVVTGCDL